MTLVDSILPTLYVELRGRDPVYSVHLIQLLEVFSQEQVHEEEVSKSCQKKVKGEHSVATEWS